MKKTSIDQPKIVDLLNEVLTAELTAINQYFVHSEMCENWGYQRLHEIIRKHSIDEMKHADTLIERILFFDGVPNVQRLHKINIGENVKEIMELDLALEQQAMERLNPFIKTCRDEGDNGTAVILEDILHSEEEHIDWLESQLEQIDQLGVQNYLAQQIRS